MKVKSHAHTSVLYTFNTRRQGEKKFSTGKVSQKVCDIFSSKDLSELCTSVHNGELCTLVYNGELCTSVYNGEPCTSAHDDARQEGKCL